MKAMLFAAGLGTRLKPFTDHHPKALAVVNGRTLLGHNIKYLQQYGIEDVIVNVHHFAGQIEDAIRDNNGFGSRVTVSDERDAVLETGGGLKKARRYFEAEEDFVVMNVDVLTSLDLGRMISAHRSSGAAATLAVMRRESSRYLLFDADMQLSGWENRNSGERRIVRGGSGDPGARLKTETGTPGQIVKGGAEGLNPFAFSGIQVLSPALLNIPFDGKFSVIDVYLHFAGSLAIKGYDHSGDIFIDAGKPESLEEASKIRWFKK